jgi:YD repeat-containing protein
MYQSHQGAVSTGSTPKLQLTYETNATSGIYTDRLRLQLMYYPAATGAYNYHSYDGRLDRLTLQKLFGGSALNGNLDRSTGYLYNGMGRVAWIYAGGRVHFALRSNTATQDFDRLDRFGRVKSQVWTDGNTTTTTHDRMDYTYDAASNRLTRNVRVDLINAAYSDLRDQDYEYDGLHRLKDTDQGTASNSTGLISTKYFEQQWTLDQLGNWPEFKIANNGTGTFSGAGDLDQVRAHNVVNEVGTITAGSGQANWVDPVHDAAGNMTTMPQPAAPTSSFALKYDAWNRLVEVRDGSNNLVQTNEYDGFGRRIVRVDAVPSTDVTYEYYYNDQWQLLTEMKDSSVEAIYQWHPYYIDALNLRMRASDMHWFMHDANFNVTAVMNDSTYAVVERNSYTPYGEVTVLNPDFSLDSSGGDGLSDIGNTHLYTGRERDPETGLQLNRHRFYSLTRSALFPIGKVLVTQVRSLTKSNDLSKVAARSATCWANCPTCILRTLTAIFTRKIMVGWICDISSPRPNTDTTMETRYRES